MQKHDYNFGPSQPKRPPENCLLQKHDYSVGPRPPRRPPEYFVMEKHDYEVGPLLNQQAHIAEKQAKQVEQQEAAQAADNTAAPPRKRK